MRLNQTTALSTRKILLVPYSSHHVPTYHGWMQDPDLQTATASEPLNLAEEYEMQRSWREDHDKLTFIIGLPLPVSNPTAEQASNVVQAGIHDGPEKMIGDINLFLLEPEHGDEEDEGSIPALIGEVELMIASPSHRWQGFGRAALLTLLQYVLARWVEIAQEYLTGIDSQTPRKREQLPSLAYLRVKINKDNEASLRLFESLGFVREGLGANYFGEVELRLPYESLEELVGKPLVGIESLEYVDTAV